MPESMSIHSDDDPDSRALKTGLGFLFFPKPTLLIVGWLVCWLFWGDIARLMMFATALWLACQFIWRPREFGAEIGTGLDGVRQFFAWTTEQLGKHLAPLVAKLNAAHRGGPKPAPAPMAFAAASRSAEASVAASAPAPVRAPRAPINWLGVLRRWWWIAPVALLALVAVRFVNWATGFINGPSAREVVADVRANEAEAEARTANAENDQIAAALRRVEEAAARLNQIEREAETAREAIRNAPTDDAAFAEHDAYVDGLRNESARDRAAALQDYRASIDP